VLGDMTRDSLDSRFDGPVRAGQIVGIASWILHPWARAGPLR
jgi:type IV secretory pathway protease TraF